MWSHVPPACARLVYERCCKGAGMWWWFGCAEMLVERVMQRVPDLGAGEAVFAEACAECHGADGTGGEGTNLTNDANSRTEIAERVLFGWGAMEGMADVLSVQETADVVEYVYVVLQSPPPTTSRAPFEY